MTAKQIIGIVSIVLGVIGIVFALVTLNDLSAAAEQAKVIGGMFGGMLGNGASDALGLESSIESEQTKYTCVAAVSLAAIGVGAMMARGAKAKTQEDKTEDQAEA